MNKPTAAEMNHKVDRALTFLRVYNIQRLEKRGDKSSRDEPAEFKNVEEVLTICTGRK